MTAQAIQAIEAEAANRGMKLKEERFAEEAPGAEDKADKSRGDESKVKKIATGQTEEEKVTDSEIKGMMERQGYFEGPDMLQVAIIGNVFSETSEAGNSGY